MKLISTVICLTIILSIIPFFENDNDQDSYQELVAKTSATLAYRFAIISDGHYNESTWGDNKNGERNIAVVESMKTQSINHFIDLGDMIDEQFMYEYYPTIKSIYDSSGINYHTVCGNHDLPSVWASTFGYSEYYYNWTYGGNLAFIVLNSRDTTPAQINETQLEYLEDALNYYSTRLVFIFMHISNIKLAYPTIEPDGKDFQAICEAHSSHIGGVFSGHVHNYNIMTYEINSVYYSYAGTFGNGYEMGGLSPYPYRYHIVNVYSDWSIKIEAIDPDNEVDIYGSNAEYSPTGGGR